MELQSLFRWRNPGLCYIQHHMRLLKYLCLLVAFLAFSVSIPLAHASNSAGDVGRNTSEGAKTGGSAVANGLGKAGSAISEGMRKIDVHGFTAAMARGTKSAGDAIQRAAVKAIVAAQSSSKKTGIAGNNGGKKVDKTTGLDSATK